MSSPLYSAKEALVAAFACALAVALVIALLANDFEWWIPAALAAVVLVAPIAFFVFVSRRDPEGRLRSLGIRTLATAGMMCLTKSLLGLSGFDADATGAGHHVVVKVLFSSPWYADLACLAFAAFAFGCMVHLLKQAAVVAQVEAEKDDKNVDNVEAPAPMRPLPEVFLERVRLLFERRAYSTYNFGDHGARDQFLIGEVRDGHGTHKVVVRCYDGDLAVPIADVDELVNYAADVAPGRTNVFYVTRGKHRVDPELAARFPSVTFRSEAELLDEMVYFGGYLKRLVEQYEVDKLPYTRMDPPPSLAKTFIAPRFEVDGKPRSGSLVSHLDAWLSDSGVRQIALLADYGMGKTSFLRHYAAHLARAALRGEDGRIPIMLTLTAQSPRTGDGARSLIDGFIGRYSLKCEYEAFDVLMRAGRLVILLDAFDEMDLITDRAMRFEQFRALWSLYGDRNKLLFAGRPAYFPTNAQMAEALRLERGPARHSGRWYCEHIALTPFEPEDVRSSFRMYFPVAEAERHIQFVEERPRLQDLACRPAMMHMIRDSMQQLTEDPELARKSTLREAVLLAIYAEHWIAQQEGAFRTNEPRRELLISTDIRRRFVEALAVEMTTLGLNKVSSGYLLDLFSRLFPDQRAAKTRQDPDKADSERPHLVEAIATDLRNCTFMKSDPGGDFAFAHRPFREYFVAAHVDRAIAERRPLEAPLRERWLTDIALHVGDLVFDRRGGDVRGAGHEIFQTVAGGGRWPRLMRVTGVAAAARLLGLSAAVDVTTEDSRRNAIQVMLRAGVPYTWISDHIFGRWGRALGLKTHGPECLAEMDLSGANFSNARMRDIRLAGVRLQGADWTSATLVGVDMRESDLRGADFGGAALHDVILHDARLPGTSFLNATLARCDLTRVDGRANAGVRPLSFLNTTFDDCVLRAANLTGATFEGAKRRNVLDFTSATLSNSRELMSSLATSGEPGDLRLQRTKLIGLGPELARSDLRLAGAAWEAPTRPDFSMPRLGIEDRRHRGVSWSPANDCLLVHDGVHLQILDPLHGTVVRTIQVPGAEAVADAEWRDDGGITVVSALGTIVIWSNSGRQIGCWAADRPTQAAAVSPDGRYVICAHDRQLSVRSATDGRQVAEHATLDTPDVVGLATPETYAWAKETVGDWTLTIERPSRRFALKRFVRVGRIAFDRSQAWCVAQDDLNGGAYVFRLARDGYQEPRLLPHSVAAAFTRDGLHLVTLESAARNLLGEVVVTRMLPEWRLVDELAATHARRVARTTDGRYTAALGVGLRIVQPGGIRPRGRFTSERVVTTGGLPRRISSEVEIASRSVPQGVTALAFQADGALVTASPRTVRTWHPSRLFGVEVNERSHVRASIARLDSGAPPPVLEPDVDRWTIAGDEAALAGIQHGQVVLLRPPDGQILGRLVVDGNAIAMTFRGPSHQQVVVTTSTHGWIISWDRRRDMLFTTPVASVPLPCPADTVVTSPNGDIVVLGCRDGVLRVWDPGTGTLNELGRHATRPALMDFRHDGRLLASASDTEAVKIWNLVDRTLLATLHHLSNGWATVLPDGRYKYDGDVSMLTTPEAMCAFTFAEIDELLPGRRMALDEPILAMPASSAKVEA